MYKQVFYTLFLAQLFLGCGGGSTDTNAPLFTSTETIYVTENHTFVLSVTTEDSATVSYTLQGGEDQEKLILNANTGALQFITAPDFENPTDADSNNIYHVQINATDSYSNTAEQNLTIYIVDQDEVPPHFTSPSHITLKENHTKVLDLVTEDTSSVQYAIQDEGDGSLFFTFYNSHTLRFKSAPNFEAPLDDNNDNNYSVTIIATDHVGNHSEQTIHITVIDIEENDSSDTDDDGIPDNIEILIEGNLSNSDNNSNGIEDGLETAGDRGDTFFDMQWHIRSTGIATNDSGMDTIVGNDLDLMPLYHHYMGYNRGNPIIVQVVDTGVDADHEDLIDNMDMSRSYNGSTIGDPSSSHTHGTMVAGIIAARAFNGKGVRGIIPFAHITGSNWLNTQTISQLEKNWLTGDGSNEIAVSNNSWGSYYDTDTHYEDFMQQGTTTLRDGKGRIYVFAAGNDRVLHGNSNLQYVLSNRFPIVVAALKHDNTYADYSTPGANILVSGYSGNYYYNSPTIGTTTIMGTSSNTGDINSKTTWAEDTQKNYTFIMNGTSAAAPTVSASIALVLEACPNLTWRDVRYLIAKHAKRIDPTNPSWVENNASLWHSIDYGFGLINPQEMIADCMGGYAMLSAEKNLSAMQTYHTVIADESNTTVTIHMPDNIIIEWVEVTIDNNSTQASDYTIELTSPQGTKTTLITALTEIYGNWMHGGFRFATPAMLDENSQGDWHINITDTQSGNIGTLKDMNLKVYGH